MKAQPSSPSTVPGLLVDRCALAPEPTLRRGRDIEPAGQAPDHVAAPRGEEADVGDGGGDRVPGEAVGDVCEADVGAVAFDLQREEPVHEDMGGIEHGESVSRHRNVTQRRPRRKRPRAGQPGTRVRPRAHGEHARRRGPVSLDVLLPPQEPQHDARPDVCHDWQGDEDRLGQGALVDLARHEEVRLGAGDGARDGGDQGDVDEVEGCEEAHGVAGEFLYAHYYSEGVS